MLPTTEEKPIAIGMAIFICILDMEERSNTTNNEEEGAVRSGLATKMEVPLRSGLRRRSYAVAEEGGSVGLWGCPVPRNTHTHREASWATVPACNG